MPLNDPTRPGVPLLVLHHSEGPVFWPTSEIAMLRQEWEGRLEATHRDGRVAHASGPLPDAPHLHELTPGVLVNPAHAQLQEGELHLPGGWRLPARPLPEPEPVTPDRKAVLGWSPGRWFTLAGELPGPARRSEAQDDHPNLVPAGEHLVDPGAVRSLRRDGPRWTLTLEGGRRLVAGTLSLDDLAAVAGLSWPDPLAALPPPERLVYERGLRDWPQPLLLQGRRALRQRYGKDALLLVDHVIWEAFRTGPGSDSPRGLFYNPLKVLAGHAGLLAPGDAFPLDVPEPFRLRQGPWTPQRLWDALQDRLDLFVGEARLLTHRDLHFRDGFAAHRRVGGRRPGIVLLVEKDSLEFDARLVAGVFDVSMLVTGGFPNWISTEFFVEALRARGPVLLVAFCDHDPYGWQFPMVLQRMLERYGVATSGLRRLVTPDRFTPEEIELLAEPVPVHPSNQKLVERWLAETGGIGGKSLGLYADYLRPVERVLRAFEEETGLRR